MKTIFIKGGRKKVVFVTAGIIIIGIVAGIIVSHNNKVNTKDKTNYEEGVSTTMNENNKDTLDSTIIEEDMKKAGREGIEAMADAANHKEMSSFRDPNSTGSFKVIGYYPNWHGDMIDQIKWDKLTHINYAFLIPTNDAGILPLQDKAVVEKLIKTAHENNVKVGVSVGGWSYANELLENTFVKATDTDEKCRILSDEILKVVDDYGFDGVDMDWEYPKQGISDYQYEFFMTYLRQGLSTREKYLTAAVVGCGSVGSGQTDYILDMLDWVNVMAYDGSEGAGHSPYSYALECGEYWINTRKVDADRVILGVPFYERPNWTSYADIVAADEAAAYKDTTKYLGNTVYYNGLPTMADKTEWACVNAGGIMIWEIMLDSENEDLSLLNQINTKALEYFPDYKK
jgi:GH18 family chitinase